MAEPSAASLDAYLATKGSPMVGQGARILAVAKAYDLDPRLLVALSGAESRFGLDTKAAFNALGIMHHGKHIPFPSYEDAFKSIAISLNNPANGYNLTSSTTIYGHYCFGLCGRGLHNLTTFMNEQQAPLTSVHYPKSEGGN